MSSFKEIKVKKNLPKMIEVCILIDQVKIIKDIDVNNNFLKTYEELVTDLVSTLFETPNSAENSIRLPENLKDWPFLIPNCHQPRGWRFRSGMTVFGFGWMMGNTAFAWTNRMDTFFVQRKLCKWY